MSETPRTVRLRSGIEVVNWITGETGQTFSEYVLLSDYEELQRENAALREQLVELAKYKELIDRVSSGEIPNAHPSWSNVVVISKESWASYEDALEQLAERDEEIKTLKHDCEQAQRNYSRAVEDYNDLKRHAFEQESSARRRYSNVAPWEIDA